VNTVYVDPGGASRSGDSFTASLVKSKVRHLDLHRLHRTGETLPHSSGILRHACDFLEVPHELADRFHGQLLAGSKEPGGLFLELRSGEGQELKMTPGDMDSLIQDFPHPAIHSADGIVAPPRFYYCIDALAHRVSAAERLDLGGGGRPMVLVCLIGQAEVKNCPCLKVNLILYVLLV
jgi:hypothetical protein